MLHITTAIDNTMDLLHDHGFHHHVLSLLPNNITLACIFCPIYHTLTAMERDVYEESDLRLVNHISSPSPVLPVPAPHEPSVTTSLETLASSPLLTTATLIDDPTDLHPAFHQVVPPPIPLELYLETPIWAQNPQHLWRLTVFNVTLQGIFVLIAQSMSAPTVVNAPLATLNTVVFETIVLFAAALATLPATAQTVSAPCATTRDMLSPTVLSRRTPVVASSLMTATWRGFELTPVVQAFKGGIVTVQGSDLVFSIVHLSPLVSTSPFMFTVSTMFLPNDYRYIVW